MMRLMWGTENKRLELVHVFAGHICDVCNLSRGMLSFFFSFGNAMPCIEVRKKKRKKR